MANTRGVGLASLAEAFAESEDSVAAETTEPASSVKSEEAEAPSGEQPNAVEPSTEEDVDLLSVLEENLGEEEEEQLKPPADDSPTHVVNGEHLTTQQLIDGYLRQADYTTKTQEIAEDRKRLANAETLYDAIQNEPVQTIRMLAQRFNMGQPLLNANAPKPAASDSNNANLDELVAQKVAEVLGSDPHVAEVKSLAATQAEDAQFASIESDYGKPLSAKDRAYVKRKAEELGVSDYRFVFASLFQEAQLRQAKKDQLRKASTAGGRRSDEGESYTPSNKEYTSLLDAAEDVMKEIGWEE